MTLWPAVMTRPAGPPPRSWIQGSPLHVPLIRIGSVTSGSCPRTWIVRCPMPSMKKVTSSVPGVLLDA